MILFFKTNSAGTSSLSATALLPAAPIAAAFPPAANMASLFAATIHPHGCCLYPALHLLQPALLRQAPMPAVAAPAPFSATANPSQSAVHPPK